MLTVLLRAADAAACTQGIECLKSVITNRNNVRQRCDGVILYKVEITAKKSRQFSCSNGQQSTQPHIAVFIRIELPNDRMGGGGSRSITFHAQLLNCSSLFIHG
jgi:hypothetical protein